MTDSTNVVKPIKTKKEAVEALIVWLLKEKSVKKEDISILEQDIWAPDHDPGHPVDYFQIEVQTPFEIASIYMIRIKNGEVVDAFAVGFDYAEWQKKG